MSRRPVTAFYTARAEPDNVHRTLGRRLLFAPPFDFLLGHAAAGAAIELALESVDKNGLGGRRCSYERSAMRKFIAAVLLIVGLVPGGVAYKSYSEYTMESNVARFYRAHPEEVPTHDNREQFIAENEAAAESNLNLAMLSGAGSLLFLLGGAALFMLGRRKDKSGAAPDGWPDEDPVRHVEEMNRWASAAVARPVEVHYSRLHGVLFALIMVFFIGMGALVVATNGFSSNSLFMLALIGLLLPALYFILNRGRKRAARFFDLSGVKRGDSRRLNWDEYRGVNYRMAIKSRSGKEYLWRVELAFAGGDAWIIPQRVKNLEVISNLISSLPGAHQKRGGYANVNS